MSASISTTSETLVVSIETDRGKLHSQANCWLLDFKGGAISVAGWFGVISSDYNRLSA